MSATRITYKPVVMDPPLVDATVLQSATESLVRSMAESTDAVLREALTRFLKRADWTVEEVRGRCERQIWPDGRDVFCCDGVPLVEFWPFVIDHEHIENSMVQRATLKYRFLIEPKKEGNP